MTQTLSIEKTDSQRIAEFREKFQKHKLFAKGAWGFELYDIESWLSTTLAEVRKETLAEVEEKIKIMKGKYKIEHGMDCIEHRRPCGAVEHPDNLADRCERYSYDLLDVCLALDQMKEEK